MPQLKSTEPKVQLALLFMPDITGFTRFVSTTEIQHAQSIIGELLEILMESNRLNMLVADLEGDAIFYYRPGKAPSVDELLGQVQHMFTRFHQHLDRYDHERICPCGACKSAKTLKLKFFAHYGEVSSHHVKDHHQVFGKDVIILHRLMKNNLDKQEYSLITNALMEQHDAPATHKLFGGASPATETYDVGDILFSVIDLADLREQIEPLKPEAIKLSAKTKVSFTEERVLGIPIEKVFLSIFDLPLRAHWFEGVDGIKILKKPGVNRIGTTHQCIADTGGNPIFVTESGHGTEKEITFVEMDPKGMGGSQFFLQKKSEQETFMKWDMLVSRNFIISTMFDLLMKKKMQRLLAKSVDNLQVYCNIVDR